MKAWLCEWILSCVVLAPGAKPLDDLTYGTVLFSYFRQDYEQALLDVMIAESQNRRGEDVVRFDLAKGSFAFSDRMFTFAEATFAEVDAAELTPLDRMRLAFHLAREDHRRGNWNRLEERLADLRAAHAAHGAGVTHPFVHFMDAEAAIAAGDGPRALAATGRIPLGDPLRAYALFNLGVWHRDAGRSAEAVAAFGELSALTANDNESRDLSQRAKLALALLTRDAGESQDARSVVGSLPAEGRYRDPALAAYGSLAMADEDYELAGRIWKTLSGSPGWNASIAIATLGLPVTLEELDATSAALAEFQAAERRFEARRSELSELIDRAREPEEMRQLLETFLHLARPHAQTVDASLGGGAFWRDTFGAARWQRFLAAEQVHELFLEWGELAQMTRWVDALPERVDVLREVSVEQRRRTQVARRMLKDDALLGRRETLHGEVVALRGRLASVESMESLPNSEWMRALATSDELVLLDRLNAMHDAGEQTAINERRRWLDRVERLQNRVFWDIADSRHARLWNVRKALASAERELADIDTRIARLQNAEAAFARGVAADFAAFEARANVVEQQLAGAMRSREARLGQALLAAAEREGEQLANYLLLTRIAIARATDALAMPQGES